MAADLLAVADRLAVLTRTATIAATIATYPHLSNRLGVLVHVIAASIGVALTLQSLS